MIVLSFSLEMDVWGWFYDIKDHFYVHFDHLSYILFIFVYVINCYVFPNGLLGRLQRAWVFSMALRYVLWLHILEIIVCPFPL